jgi:hypothetical protein
MIPAAATQCAGRPRRFFEGDFRVSEIAGMKGERTLMRVSLLGRPSGEMAICELAILGPLSRLWGRTRDSGLGLLFKFRRTRAGWNRGSGRGFAVESSRRVSCAKESRLSSDLQEFAIPCSFV